MNVLFFYKILSFSTVALTSTSPIIFFAINVSYNEENHFSITFLDDNNKNWTQRTISDDDALGIVVSGLDNSDIQNCFFSIPNIKNDQINFTYENNDSVWYLSGTMPAEIYRLTLYIKASFNGNDAYLDLSVDIPDDDFSALDFINKTFYGYVGSSVEWQMSFNNNLFDDYTVALDSGLPAGLSFNSSTLIISGCATAEWNVSTPNTETVFSVESPLLDGPRALSIIIYICNNSYVYDSISSSLPDYTNDFGSCTIAQNDQQQSINFTSLFEQSHSDSSFEYQWSANVPSQIEPFTNFDPVNQALTINTLYQSVSIPLGSYDIKIECETHLNDLPWTHSEFDLNVNIIQQRKSINDILHFDLLSIVHSSSPSDDIYDYEIIDCLNNKVENFVFSKHNISCDVNASHFSVTISGFNELRDSKTLSLWIDNSISAVVPDGLYIDYLQSPNSEIIKQRILQKYPKASSFLNNDNLSVNIDAQKCSALLDANNVLGWQGSITVLFGQKQDITTIFGKIYEMHWVQWMLPTEMYDDLNGKFPFHNFNPTNLKFSTTHFDVSYFFVNGLNEFFGFSLIEYIPD